MKELISDRDLASYTDVLRDAIRDGIHVSECSVRYRLNMATDLKTARDALSQANAENAALKEELREWKANHEQIKQRCSLLRERHDLPVDRIPAYEELVRLQGIMPDLLKPKVRGIGDALALLPQTTLAYQYVRECLRNVRDRKGGECDLTFTTNQMTCNDYMSGQGKICVAIWCGREELNAALETIRQRNLS